MPTTGTTVGPLTEATRDQIKSIRDREGYPNYERTLAALAEAYDSDTEDQ